MDKKRRKPKSPSKPDAATITPHIRLLGNGIPVISEAEEQTSQSKKARSQRRRIIYRYEG